MKVERELVLDFVAKSGVPIVNAIEVREDGFHAGPEGLRILNFRPRNDTTFNLPPNNDKDS